MLLVEDEAALLDLGKTILEDQGYKVLAAQSPLTALKLASDHAGPLDLLVTDVIMPEMNGRELNQAVIAARPGVKTLFMSGYPAELIAHHGVIDEGVNFLQKPFTAKVLASKVREVLDS
ncbi:MAG: Blue-light-activated protein [Deltaproteobacteria bacterium ADurb.Bin510]|nr:MAG: Blue-light-activated protein [Deltaproteobacteria bacterium ADurb.Bin510]